MKIHSKKYQTAAINAAVLLSVIVCMSTPSWAQNGDMRALLNRLSQMETQIQTLSQHVYRGATPSFTIDSSGVSSNLPETGGHKMAAMGARLDEMDTTIRELTGQLEEQNYLLGKLGDEVKKSSSQNGLEQKENVSSDGIKKIDARLEQLSKRLSSLTDDLKAMTVRLDGVENLVTAQIKELEDTAPKPIQLTPTPTTPAAPSQKNLASSENMSAVENSKKSPEIDGKKELKNLETKEAVITELKTDNPSELYDEAFSLIKAEKYGQAREKFSKFFEKFPNHTLIDNARYWNAETFYVEKQYKQAARLFAEGYQGNPQGQKAPDNLLKLALSLSALGQTSDACVTLRQLENAYPSALPAIRGRMTTEMKNLGCL